MNAYYKTTSSRRLYRSRDGLIFGVCKGLANYAEISTCWIRAFAILAVIITGFWPFVLLYIAAAIFLKPAPVLSPNSAEDFEFYESYIHDRSWTLRRLKKRFDILERRTRRMENVVTNKEYDWERRFRSNA